MKKYLWIGIGIVIVVALSIMLIVTQTKKEAEEINIGAILPLTGDGGKYGDASKKGIELALDEINASGGVKGKRIKMIYEDTQGDPKFGVSAMQKLVTVDKVIVVIGGLFSSVTLAVSPIANQNKVVLLSPASSSPKITNAGDYIFRNCASDIFEGSIIGKHAFAELGFKKVAILYINNDYGVGIRDVFKREFMSRGGTVTSEESFEQGATDFRTQLTKIKGSEPEAIYMVGYKELGQLLKQAKELGITSQFLSTVMFEDPEIVKIAGGAAEGVIYSSRAYDTESKEGVTYDFVRRFKQKYNETPDIFAGLSYDAMKILALAMERGGFNSDGIKGALYGIKHYPALVGDTSFDENGDVIQPAVIKTVKGGKFVKFSVKKSR